jgi:DNA-binding NtrC family response regulator
MKHIDVLIVDDEQKFATMLAKRLELRNCTSEVCFDGKSALARVAEKDLRFSLILLDLQLPDLYGTAVLASIKAMDPALPVVIVTGHGTRKDEVECRKLGARMFLHKPLNLDTLMTLLGELGTNTQRRHP